jgi:hypothetical protein
MYFAQSAIEQWTRPPGVRKGGLSACGPGLTGMILSSSLRCPHSASILSGVPIGPKPAVRIPSGPKSIRCISDS